MNVQPLLARLWSPKSAERRAAAKTLRGMRAAEAGPALLEALKREVLDERTWETQHQMVMALGDAIVRLAREHEHDGRPVVEWMHCGNPMLANGAFRAMAMLRMVSDGESIGEILAFLRELPANDPLRFWVAAAAPGWDHPALGELLNTCESSGCADLIEAARLARDRKYKSWPPL